ncbi:MAG: sulfate ABC transporter permease subunit [Chlamydiae bacterium]|nr:sulfate ABC transporter permease subunit [Chlamydiota bacterium]MBI3266977.1 sulfate ABC transporter permease subunit [Chlamydiota bacterium]
MKKKSKNLIKFLLIVITLVYLFVLLIFPNFYLLWEAFKPGLKTFYLSSTTHYALCALRNTGLVVSLSLLITLPLGILTSITLVRDKFFGRKFLNGLVDLPFAAPAAIGAFALMSTYGPRGLLGALLDPLGIKIVFALPGMILATVFVTLPFIIREVGPLLEELGREAEDAARTLGASRWQTLRWVTLPSLKEGIIDGISLSFSRALGEFGAILIISGNISGVTQTMPIYIYDAYIDFHMEEAYTGAVVLIALSLAGRFLLELWRKNKKI